MKKTETKTNKYDLSRIIWSNIRKYQYLYQMNDTQLAELMGVCPKTIASYDKNPEVLQLGKIRCFVDGTGVSMEDLIK